jgi:hypothetical protein
MLLCVLVASARRRKMPESVLNPHLATVRSLDRPYSPENRAEGL